jgi:hypothetical protein
VKFYWNGDKMSNLTHKNDGGFMKKQDNGVRCQKCGYFLKQSEITSAYLYGKIILPFPKGPSKMTM